MLFIFWYVFLSIPTTTTMMKKKPEKNLKILSTHTHCIFQVATLELDIYFQFSISNTPQRDVANQPSEREWKIFTLSFASVPSSSSIFEVVFIHFFEVFVWLIASKNRLKSKLIFINWSELWADKKESEREIKIVKLLISFIWITEYIHFDVMRMNEKISIYWFFLNNYNVFYIWEKERKMMNFNFFFETSKIYMKKNNENCMYLRMKFWSDSKIFEIYLIIIQRMREWKIWKFENFYLFFHSLIFVPLFWWWYLIL